MLKNQKKRKNSSSNGSEEGENNEDEDDNENENDEDEEEENDVVNSSLEENIIKPAPYQTNIKSKLFQITDEYYHVKMDKITFMIYDYKSRTTVKVNDIIHKSEVEQKLSDEKVLTSDEKAQKEKEKEDKLAAEKNNNKLSIIKLNDNNNIQTNNNNKDNNKEEIMKSLTKLDHSTTSIQNKLDEKEAQISLLLDQIKKQEPLIQDYNILKTKYNSIKNELLLAKNEYEILKSNISFNQIESENKNNEIEKYVKQIEKLKLESEKMKQNIEQLNQERKKKEKEILIYKEKGIRYDILEEENDNLNQKVIVLNASMAYKDKEILNLKNLNDELTKTNNSLNKQVDEFKKILHKKDRNYDDLSSEKKSDKIVMNDLINKNIALINDNHNLKNNNSLLNNELEETLNKMTILNHQISTNDLEIKETKNIIHEIKARNEKLELINKDFINQIQNLHNKIAMENKKNSELNSQVIDCQKNLYELKRINDNNNKVISDMGINKEALNKIIDQLKKENTDLKNTLKSRKYNISKRNSHSSQYEDEIVIINKETTYSKGLSGESNDYNDKYGRIKNRYEIKRKGDITSNEILKYHEIIQDLSNMILIYEKFFFKDKIKPKNNRELFCYLLVQYINEKFKKIKANKKNYRFRKENNNT